jgi:hypothetical protein
MNIVDALTGEHGLLYAQFDRFEAEAPRLESLGALRAEADLLIASLQAHLSLEDTLLCSRMTAHVKRQPPIVGCEISHEEVDAGLARFRAAGDAAQAREHLLAVVALARRHSGGQERWLFPMARRLLGETTLRALGAEWSAWRGIASEPDSAEASRD